METLFRDNENLQRAAAGALPPGLRLVLSGHIHLFQVLNFGACRPPQLVAGMSGTALDPPIMTPLTGLTIDGLTVEAGVALSMFGYVTLAEDALGLRAELHRENGSIYLGWRLPNPKKVCDG